MEHSFDAPPAGAAPTAQERAHGIKYKALKTPQQYAHIEISLQEQVEKFHLGFHYFDKEAGAKVALPELTFVVLEMYAGISGYNGTDTSFWSNRALDTRTDELIVYASNHSGPITKGLYQSIKDQLPDGASYTKFAKAYCTQLQKTVEIELTAAVERGMQKAVAACEIEAGRKAKWQSVFVLGLAQNDHLWGFHLKTYVPTDKAGNPYDGKGDKFMEPYFHAGIVNPVKSPELHRACVAAQAAERALHESYKQKYAVEATQQQAQPEGLPNNYAFPENNAPAKANIRPSAAANTFPTNNAEMTNNPALAEAGFPREEPESDLHF